MNKEEMQTTIKKMLELKEPVLVPVLGPKLAPKAQLIYIISLVFLALSVLFSLVSLLFGSFSAAIIGLIFVVVEAVVLRMFCEFLLSCQDKQ